MVFGTCGGCNMKYCFNCTAIIEVTKDGICTKCKQEIKPPEDKDESRVQTED